MPGPPQIEQKAVERWVWWHTPVVPAVRRLRWEGCDESGAAYVVSSGTLEREREMGLEVVGGGRD